MGSEHESLTWARQVLGDLGTVEGRGPWRVVGGRYFVKQLRPGRAFAQAMRAYDLVVPELAERGVPVPTRLASDPKTRSVLVTTVPGEVATMSSPPHVFEQAGRAIAVLHSVSCVDGDPVPLAEALRGRARSLRHHERVSRLLEAARLDRPRRWCHRDVQPRNWVGGGLVDFEHCRPDHPLTDWVRLEARGWSPAQRAAFVEGYGGEPEPGELRALLALYGLQTVCWAEDHGDAELVSIGRAALERALGAPWSARIR